MLNIQPATLRSTLDELEQATHDHLEWHADLLRTIVCELPGDPHDISAQAHRLCRFGRWYYGRAPVELHEQSAFVAIGTEHRQAHEVAATILRDIASGRPVRRQVFDELVAASLRLRSELDLLKRELHAALRSRDALTGAFDRDHVIPELRRWRAPTHPAPPPCCVVLIDLDHLREVNERHGHLVGDGLLAEAATVLRERLRPDDQVFRYGGDEFLVTLPHADLSTARDVVAGMRDGLARRQLFVAAAGPALRLTASFGIAQLEPDLRVEDSIDQAAQALLLAKTAGGNRAISWDPSATTGRHWRRLEIDERLRAGVDIVEARATQYTGSDAGPSTVDDPGGD